MIYKNSTEQYKAALKSMLQNFDLNKEQYDSLMAKVEQPKEN